MKKLAVVCLFLFIALGLFFLKENFNLKSRGEAKKADVVLTWDYNPKSIDLQTPVNFTFTLKDRIKKYFINLLRGNTYKSPAHLHRK